MNHFEARNIMNIDHFIQSELKVTASENLDISKDLEAQQNNSISELLDNEKTEKNSQDQEKNEDHP